MKTTEKVLLAIGALGVLGAAAFVIYKLAKTKSAAKKEAEAREFRKKNPYKPLTETEMGNISKSFSQSIEKRLQDFGKSATKPTPTPFAQSGGFTNPSLGNLQSPIFQPLNLSNKPSGTLNYTPRYLNAVGQFGIAGI